MKFRNYCIVVMGDTLGAQDEIIKISETKPNILDAKGILIATFSSIVEPRELTEWFVENNRSFLVFDLNKNNSGFNITKKEIQEGLFGFLNDINVEEMGDRFIKTININEEKEPVKRKRATKTTKQKVDVLTKELIEKMSSSDKQELLNRLIDNGLEKLSEADKKLLPMLAK